MSWQAAAVGVKQVHCWGLDGGWDVCVGVMEGCWDTGEDNGELMRLRRWDLACVCPQVLMYRVEVCGEQVCFRQAGGWSKRL